ncbi:MAG: hypothetical protein H0V20_06335 [Actinobacteria bacterium]|nr:hypothetical protein [Actinomycetota bacterium]
MPSARLWVPAAVILVATIAIGLTSGWGGAFVFLFLATIAAVLAFAVTVGGDWTRDVSRGRFRHRNKRDR